MSTKTVYAVSTTDYLALLAERVAATLAPIFQAHGWAWSDKIPNEEQLYETALGLIEQAMNNDYSWLATGRMVVARDDADDGDVMLTVLLEVAQVTLEASK